jgi:NADH-quinone oxidoreductase subunit N
MNWLAIYPEIVLLVMACVITLADLWVEHPLRTPTYLLSQATLAVVAAMHFAYFEGGATLYGMQRMVVTDPLGHLLGFFATVP